jgi:hypothetical protein
MSYETKMSDSIADRAKFDHQIESKADVDKFEVFNDWLLRNGAKFDSLELKVGNSTTVMVLDNFMPS